ncbi:XRE family transcriptional regulator [Weissella hellenica]|nr:XRE family transcriptional regulator [Weissella hellenica]
MIKFRLGVLLAQMGYRQDDVSQATGISKNTLSNIVNNKTTGIQNNNLQKIALFLNVDISDLFEYYPVMYSFSAEHITIENLSLTIEDSLFSLTSNENKALLGLTIHLTKNSLDTTSINLAITPLINDGSFGILGKNKYVALISSYRDFNGITPDPTENSDPFNNLNYFLKDVPTTFLPDLKNDLQKFINKEIVKTYQDQWSILFPDSNKKVVLILGENKLNKRFEL